MEDHTKLLLGMIGVFIGIGVFVTIMKMEMDKQIEEGRIEAIEFDVNWLKNFKNTTNCQDLLFMLAEKHGFWNSTFQDQAYTHYNNMCKLGITNGSES